jgi:hypothetical protein
MVVGGTEAEPALLAQIQRMAKSLATMQEQLVKVAMERDDARRALETRVPICHHGCHFAPVVQESK